MVETNGSNQLAKSFDCDKANSQSLEGKPQNCDTLLGFVAKSLNTSDTWTRRQRNADEKKVCLKNVYNYATLGNAENESEKTAMCRIAELARYHKLKHEYVLFDESGPAHMKCFTVKLVLCSDQEFSGTGPSIKKAQQAAAEVALNNTTLSFPPQRIKRLKRDELDPVVLLNQLAYQLNLLVEYQNETICVPSKTRQSVIRSSQTSTLPPLVAGLGSPPLLSFQSLIPPPTSCINSFNAPNSLISFPVGLQSAIHQISQQCSSPAFLSSSPFGLKFSSADSSKNNQFHHLTEKRQPADNKSSLQMLPQTFPTRNGIYNNNHRHVNAQLNQLISSNCFNFSTSLYSQQSRNSSLPFSGIQNNGNKSFLSTYQQNSIGLLFGGKQSVNSLSNTVPTMFSQSKGSFRPQSANFPFHPSFVLAPFLQQPLQIQPVISTLYHKNLLTGNKRPENKLNELNGKDYSNIRNGETFQVFRTTLKLSDGSSHLGTGANKAEAKVNAATQALSHLRPILEKLQTTIKRSDDSEESRNKESTQEKKSSMKTACDDLTKQFTIHEDLTKLPTEFSNWTLINDEGDGSGSEEDLLESIVRLDENENNITTNETTMIDEKINNPKNIYQNSSVANHNQANGNAKKRRKSVVSLIHECAFQLRMNVEFEMLTEEGEPHNRQFTVRCRLTSPKSSEVIEADGRGPSKKIAKQSVCQIIYEKIKGIEKDPLYLASVIVKNNRKSTLYTQSKANKRKIIVKQRRSDPQYGNWINPVSRLIQVMQANNLPEPVFKLVGEQGQNRYKEFVVEVTCFDNICEEGTGQNKKLAKRAAADAMLRRIGYVKPMPQPGKSLLKKTTEVKSVEISVFDPSEFFSSSSEADNKAVTGNNNDSLNNYNLIESEKKNNIKTTNMETFADVENLLKVEQSSQLASQIVEENSVNLAPAKTNGCSTVKITASTTNDDSGDSSRLLTGTKRRVTFSNQVSACPPPDDANYPDAQIAPLKSEMVPVGNKLRKRGRDSKKTLTTEERDAIASVTKMFLNHLNSDGKLLHSSLLQQNPLIADENHSSVVNANSYPPNAESTLVIAADAAAQVLQFAKNFLDIVAKTHKFSVIYSDFPKTEESPSGKQCFSLVTLGIDKPIVCPGSGHSQEEAHEDAAANAIKELSQLNNFVQK